MRVLERWRCIIDYAVFYIVKLKWLARKSSRSIAQTCSKHMKCQTTRPLWPLHNRAAKPWGLLLHIRLAAQLLCVTIGGFHFDMTAVA
jgi:hypothetical protein